MTEPLARTTRVHPCRRPPSAWHDDPSPPERQTRAAPRQSAHAVGVSGVRHGQDSRNDAGTAARGRCWRSARVGHVAERSGVTHPLLGAQNAQIWPVSVLIGRQPTPRRTAATRAASISGLVTLCNEKDNLRAALHRASRRLISIDRSRHHEHRRSSVRPYAGPVPGQATDLGRCGRGGVLRPAGTGVRVRVPVQVLVLSVPQDGAGGVAELLGGCRWRVRG